MDSVSKDNNIQGRTVITPRIQGTPLGRNGINSSSATNGSSQVGLGVSGTRPIGSRRPGSPRVTIPLMARNGSGSELDGSNVDLGPIEGMASNEKISLSVSPPSSSVSLDSRESLLDDSMGPFTVIGEDKINARNEVSSVSEVNKDIHPDIPSNVVNSRNIEVVNVNQSNITQTTAISVENSMNGSQIPPSSTSSQILPGYVTPTPLPNQSPVQQTTQVQGKEQILMQTMQPQVMINNMQGQMQTSSQMPVSQSIQIDTPITQGQIQTNTQTSVTQVPMMVTPNIQSQVPVQQTTQMQQNIPTPQQAAMNTIPQKPPPTPHNFTPTSIQNMLKYQGNYSHIPDYDSMPMEEQYRFRSQFILEFGKLRKAWSTYEIPLVDQMPLRLVHVTYEVFCRGIAIFNKVDEYKFYIAIILLTVEITLTKFLLWPAQGLTMLIWKGIPFLEKYLFEMAENYFTGGGGSWSPEANLLYYGGIFAVAIIAFKVILNNILGASTIEFAVNVITQFFSGVSSMPVTTSTGNNVASLPNIGHTFAGFGVDSLVNNAPGLANTFIPSVTGAPAMGLNTQSPPQSNGLNMNNNNNVNHGTSGTNTGVSQNTGGNGAAPARRVFYED